MPTPSRRLPPFLIGIGSVAALAAGAAAARRWLDVVEVQGHSMAPALLPGDRLIVEARSFARRLPQRREVVLAPDPREPARELVKRVAAVDEREGVVALHGDAPDSSTDSRTFGAIPIDRVRWRIAARYWPPGRLGRI
jgi:nickel-type superoxide dismutase maturation protease